MNDFWSIVLENWPKIIQISHDYIKNKGGNLILNLINLVGVNQETSKQNKKIFKQICAAVWEKSKTCLTQIFR